MKEYSQNKITRRDFLKNLGLIGSSFLYQPLIKFTSSLPEKQPVIEKLDIERLIPANRIGVILEYHNPNYEGDVSMREKMFLSQLEFLKNNKYHTLGETEIIDFIQGKSQPPYKSAILRFDLGGGYREEFEKIVIPALRKFSFKGLFYLTTGSLKEKQWWEDLVQWHKEDLIDVGSHSVSHPDFNMINQKQALKEAVDSKNQIEKEFADRGEVINVKGFAFPYDSACGRNFLKNVGYLYSLGGNPPGFENKFIKFGSYDPNSIPLLPSLYPYTDKWTANHLPNASNSDNLLSIPLGGSIRTFDRLVFNFTQSLSVDLIKKTLEISQYNPIFMGDFQPSLINKSFEGKLVKPSGICIYYKRNFSKDSTVHFQINLNQLIQKLSLYNHFVTPATENSNNLFNIAIEAKINEDESQKEILASLVAKLINQYAIDPKRIFTK